MRIIPTRVHGVLDYLMGGLLMALPFMLGWNEPERTMMIILGAGTIGLSLFTRYELGAIKVIPMGFHLLADLFVAGFLIIAPFAYDRIDSSAGMIMMILGATEALVVLMSKTRPSSEFMRHDTRMSGHAHG